MMSDFGISFFSSCIEDGWIQTVSGHKISLLTPSPDEIDIDDIAHSLSFLCRYNGQLESFYSVAEHCILVSQGVESLLRFYSSQKTEMDRFLMYTGCLSNPDPLTKEKLIVDFALSALLHDAAEAYIGDVTSPLKNLLPQYRAIEKIIEKTIYIKYGIGHLSPHDDLIKLMDYTLLSTEIEEYIPRRSPDMTVSVLSDPTIRFYNFPAGEAKNLYLLCFDNLMKRRNNLNARS